MQLNRRRKNTDAASGGPRGAGSSDIFDLFSQSQCSEIGSIPVDPAPLLARQAMSVASASEYAELSCVQFRAKTTFTVYLFWILLSRPHGI
jgi:hypothetical protein